MSVVRAFIAVDLPSDLQERLAQVAGELREQMGDAPVRWVAAGNMHLTLKFLGDVSLNNLDVLKDIMRGETADRKPMVISFGGLGAYPKPRSPRVIWIGVEAPAEFEALQRGIDQQTAGVGYARDRRPFSPHLTLGRVSRNATPKDVRMIGDVLCAKKVGFLGVARVHEVHLYRSDLQPGGAVYKRLFSAGLKVTTQPNGEIPEKRV
ncbi:MAG: RNA 2',3'-cyclic phosphodiesterase [Chloroflexi bacterium]|nr:RNA 2',3'-cyclic phosphodiesterase [Chloroflexota bacterium]